MAFFVYLCETTEIMIQLNEYKGCEIDGCYFDNEDLSNLQRLQKQLFEEENIIASIEECVNIWQTYSNDLSASWLFFPDEDKYILKYIKSSNCFSSFEEYAK